MAARRSTRRRSVFGAWTASAGALVLGACTTAAVEVGPLTSEPEAAGRDHTDSGDSYDHRAAAGSVGGRRVGLAAAARASGSGGHVEDALPRDDAEAGDERDADAVALPAPDVGVDGGGIDAVIDGTLVVAARERPDGPADLFLVAPGGGVPRPLTRTPSRHELHPRWSPDRSKVAFLALPADAPPGATASLFVIDPDGANERELAADVSGVFAWAANESPWPPAWSPSGDRIAYAHPLPSCAPPPNPEWYTSDPCLSDLRVVDVASATPSDPGLPSSIGKWATEPIWLATGSLLYAWTCFGEGCPGTGPTLVQEQPARRSMELGGRHLAFTRSASRFLLTVQGEVVSAAYAHRAASGEILACDSEQGFAAGYTGKQCAAVGPEARGWSPRWSPREGAVAFLRDDGVWVQTIGAPQAVLALATPRPAGLDW